MTGGAWIGLGLIIWMLIGGIIAEADLMGWERRQSLPARYWTVPETKEHIADALSLAGGFVLFLVLCLLIAWV